MNIVMISPVHPATPHISAVRAASFARELAALGHRVVLLTAQLAGRDCANHLQPRDHDWSMPLVLEVENPPLSVRSLPLLLRKLLTAGQMLLWGGSRGAWVDNAIRGIADLAPDFRPDIVWCTFGQLEAAVAARSVASHAHCPWVLDIKDNWELYVPKGIRRLMAWRIRGWSAVTANAEITSTMARKWLGAEARVIYSGVDAVFLGEPTESHGSPPTFLAVVGSLYFPEYLSTLLSGIGKWILSLDAETQKNVCVKYLGGDVAMFKDVARTCIPGVRVDVLGYLPIDQMAGVCQQAVANMYIGHAAGFHHKLLELLACRRPLIVCPGEAAESRQLAREVEGVLYEAATEEQVVESLTTAFSLVQHRTGSAGANKKAAESFSWLQQSLRLEAVLTNLIKGGV